MTGRTNVGGGGTALNADVVPKIIKSGSITAGDFVNYFTVASIVNYQVYTKLIGFLGDYTVVAIDGTIGIIKEDILVNRYFDYELTSLYNVYIIGNYIVYNNSSVGIVVLKIVNDILTLVDTHAFTSAVLKLFYNNQKLIGFYGNSSGYSKCFVCDIDNTGHIQNPKESTVSFSTYGGDIDVKYYNNWYYVIVEGSESEKFQLNQQNEVTGFTRAYYWQQKKIFLYQNGNKVLYRDSRIDETGVYWLNIVEGTSISVTGINGFIVSCREESGHVYLLTITSSGDVSVYEFNPSTVSVAKIADGYSLYPYGNYYYANSWIKDNIINAYYQSNSKKKLVVVGSSITNIPDTNYVIPYSGNVNPIGVAKDSGRTDDIIDVYVPTPIS